MIREDMLKQQEEIQKLRLYLKLFGVEASITTVNDLIVLQVMTTGVDQRDRAWKTSTMNYCRTVEELTQIVHRVTTNLNA